MKHTAVILVLVLLALTGQAPAVAQPEAGGVKLEPQGPDELFTSLPPVTYEGKVPAECRKYIVLHVPNEGSWNDKPAQDLTGSQRVAAGAFELILEQQLQYRPYFRTENIRARMERYSPMLRQADVPRVGSGDVAGKNFTTLNKALDTYGAQLAFVMSFAPGEKDAPAQAMAYSYTSEGGVLTRADWLLPKLGKPDADSALRITEEQVLKVIGPQGAADAEGKWQEYPFAPVPRLCASDEALREYVNMRDAFNDSELSSALIHYETLMKKDPACGRAALYGMEIYRAVAEGQTDAAEGTRYRDGALRIMREGLKHAPNDVMLRGKLCWLAGTHYNRFEFAQTGIKEALRVQPACVELFEWWIAVYTTDDRDKQKQWLVENALPLVKDGRIEFLIGTLLYTSINYAGGVEWYEKAVAKGPQEHEWWRAKGLCGTYLAEALWKDMQKKMALDAWIAATEALAKCQDIDPRDVRWVYEYYPRVATRNYSHIPVAEADQERLFMTQAVVTGLETNSRTWAWEKQMSDLLPIWKRTLRETCKEAKPGDDKYEMKLMVRLQFATIDDDKDEIVQCLWTMFHYGLRTDNYNTQWKRYGPVVMEYQPKDEGDK